MHNLPIRLQTDLQTLKLKTLTDYVMFCIKLDETPKEIMITLINNCNDFDALKKCIDIIQKGKV